ncbi:hypothetical protein Pr1d_15980 [Bythopirellula goksoeyrii]|uniref:Uncharacterized protein n=1 Tax=Bythopirellula goksoeyrii TaxID=1400387 RepID=A0A5B9QJQ0_9BACT|nr:hypothetical protein Pr1d_15980 [Bythopirellula goksoeyrii]
MGGGETKPKAQATENPLALSSDGEVKTRHKRFAGNEGRSVQLFLVLVSGAEN